MRAVLLYASLIAAPAAAQVDIAAHLVIGDGATVSGNISLERNSVLPPTGTLDLYLIEVPSGWGEITGTITSVEPDARPRVLILSAEPEVAP
jgi:hypothetical protein